VFEFFMPEAWFRDYEITAAALGIGYRGFWNDTSFAYPGFNNRDVADFNGVDIPIHAPAVVSEIRRVLGPRTLDDLDTVRSNQRSNF